ncbi:MAG: fused MFS/spermidine synthase [Alphaproteobacteria bacterium]|nr:fused MFS/spermidine synthase [Alphaproteobacteria bacterium]MCW5741368.1 fused MFS/spermidine synthase [Alphaproteobacteria bacterium]
MTSSTTPRTALAFLFALFFFSGFSALVYQTAWHRLLGLFGGADSISAAIVVGAFLLGLGIGSLVAGLRADRLSRRAALLLFAACELGIALFAALSPWLFHEVVFARLAPLSSSRLTMFLIVFACLLWPTFLMGCSLPLLSKAIVQDIAASARQIGWLYGLNTLGAGIGALVAGWVVIGHLGYDGAIYLAAAINVAIAAGGVSLAVTRGLRADCGAASSARTIAGGDAPVGRWCFLVFVSGFSIVALQIVWYRLIGVTLQSNAYGFSLVLGVFLVGDAVGLLAGARVIDRIADPRGFFFRMQAIAALLGIGGALLTWWLIGWGVLPDDMVDKDIVAGADARPWLIAVLLALVVLPASFVMGFSFPVVQKAVQRDLAAVGRRVGYVQLANIVGNSAGSLVAGLALLHWLGTSGTLKLIAVIGLAFALIEMLRDRSATRLRIAGAAVALGACIALLPATHGFWTRLHGLKTAERAIVAEDRTGVVMIRLTEAERGRMYIAGHSQSCLPFCTVHAFLGAIGPLAHTDPKRVLVIGSGSGGTPYSAGVNPATERVRAIEIVEPVVDSLRIFVASGGRIGIDRLLSAKRFDFHIGDGRHALAVDTTRYHVIEADAILPKSSLSGLLYSVEFFQQVKARLEPGGLYVQWAPTDRSVATFRSVFPYVTMVHPALIGSDRPIAYDPAAIQRKLDDPAIRGHFEAAGVDVTELRRWFGEKKPDILNDGRVEPFADANTDLFPRDEYYLNRRDPVGH